MNLGKYIHDLLLENETVIIPDFGAFTSIYKSSEIDEETDELKPPTKVIGFNSQIRNNDGLLVGKVANEEGIPHSDALKQIEKERENIIYYLDKIGRTTLEETGELFYNENNEIQFNPVEDENILLDSYGLEPISLNDIFEEVEEEEEIEKETQETDPELKQALSGLLNKIETPKPEFQIPDDYDNEPVESEETGTEEPEKAPVYSLYEEYEKRKKRRWLWLLVILIPIIAVGIYLKMTDKTDEYVDPYKEFEESIPLNKEEPVTQPELNPELIDSTVISESDSILQTEEETEPKQVERIIDPDTPKYYLVSGSFKEEENAQEYFDRLKSEGLEPIHVGKNGSYFIIGIGAYNSSSEALEAKKEYESKNSKPGVWILKK